MAAHPDSVTLRLEVHQEGLQFVATCLDIPIASQAETEDGAVENLEEAVRLWFDTASAAEVDRALQAIASSSKEVRTIRVRPYRHGQAPRPVRA